MVSRVIVNYKVKPDHAGLNEQLVRAVYQELERTAPAGFHYATFVKEDGVSFVHLASHEGEGRTPLLNVAAFQEFQKGLEDRCQEPPVVEGLRAIGSYRFDQF